MTYLMKKESVNIMALPKKLPMSGISHKKPVRQVVDDENPLIPDDSGVLEAVKLQEDVEIISVDILEEGAGAPSVLLDKNRQDDSINEHLVKSNNQYHIMSGSEFCTLENSVVEGKMVVFPSEVIQYIGNPPDIEILIGEDEMFLIPMFDETAVPLKVQDNKYIAYSEELFDFISRSFNLDFSCRTSFTFYNLEYKQLDGEDIATCFFTDYIYD